MRFHLPSHDLDVRWAHWTTGLPGVKAVTVCEVRRTDYPKEGDLGVACCAEQDQFVKAVGRKLSFTRAIAGYSRGQRGLLWAQYWQQTHLDKLRRS